MKAGALKKVEAHAWEPEPHEHYVEPSWCDDALFQAEKFDGLVLDPCCGWGRIPRAAHRAGLQAIGGDIVDRCPGTFIRDFLGALPEQPVNNIVMNPPFDLGKEFIKRACEVTRHKVASVLPIRRLPAAWWMRALPLKKVWYLTPRPSMPPGRVVEELMISTGEEPSGGTQDFCWVIFDHAFRGEPTTGWLHRDRGPL